MITKEYVDKQFEQLNDPNFDIDRLDKSGRSLLFLACKICDFEKILLLIKLSCNINIVDNVGYNCLLTVCGLTEKYENKFQIVKYFIEQLGLLPNCYTNKNESCLYLACKTGNVELAQYLLHNYPDLLDVKPDCESSCIEISIVNNHLEIFLLLLKYGADVNDMNDASGMSCLMTASFERQYEMAKKLIESGAEINLINFKNRNALYYAVYHMNNNDDTILFLLENGAFVCDRTRKMLLRSTNKEILKYIDC